GRGLSEALCAQGAIVYAADINQSGLDDVEKAAKGSGQIIPIRIDVSREEDFRKAIEEVLNTHRKLDLIINNAGIVMGGDFNENSTEQLKKIIDINLWGAIYGTKQAYQVMRTQGHGHIVNISSSAGAMPVPMSTAYATTKHAIVGLSTSLREEAALYGIRVSVVLPGMVKSRIWDDAINVKGYNYKKTMESTPLKPISSDQAAQAILKGIEANQRDIV
ncbi:MAG: SDR family oxidoreductase, partial [Planctomycetes bacterium]|nr:SDR family oxidoreductase [Planctomycetota bacterium]